MLMEQMPTGKRTRPHGYVCENLPPDVDTNILPVIGVVGFLSRAPMRSLRGRINMPTSLLFFRWIMSTGLYAYRAGLMRNRWLNKNPMGFECVKDKLCTFHYGANASLDGNRAHKKIKNVLIYRLYNRIYTLFLRVASGRAFSMSGLILSQEKKYLCGSSARNEMGYNDLRGLASPVAVIICDRDRQREARSMELGFMSLGQRSLSLAIAMTRRASKSHAIGRSNPRAAAKARLAEPCPIADRGGLVNRVQSTKAKASGGLNIAPQGLILQAAKNKLQWVFSMRDTGAREERHA